MPKAPPFYISTHVGDYLKNTPGLGPSTWEHHGIYCSLRLLAWNTPGCRLPTDERWITGKLGCTIEIFSEKVRPVLQYQFKQRRNWWYDEDLSTAYKKAVNLSFKQSNRASHSKQTTNISAAAKPSLLPSKKQQQHRKLDSAVEKKKPRHRFLSNLKNGNDV